MRLFIDIDDTLVIWEDEMQGDIHVRQRWHFNTELLEAITEYIRKTSQVSSIYIWSGGGLDYATSWKERISDDPGYWIPQWDNSVIHKTPIITLSKDPSILPSEEDLCIDDEELKTKARVMSAEQFIGMNKIIR